MQEQNRPAILNRGDTIHYLGACDCTRAHNMTNSHLLPLRTREAAMDFYRSVTQPKLVQLATRKFGEKADVESKGERLTFYRRCHFEDNYSTYTTTTVLQ